MLSDSIKRNNDPKWVKKTTTFARATQFDADNLKL